MPGTVSEDRCAENAALMDMVTVVETEPSHDHNFSALWLQLPDCTSSLSSANYLPEDQLIEYEYL